MQANEKLFAADMPPLCRLHGFLKPGVSFPKRGIGGSYEGSTFVSRCRFKGRVREIGHRPKWVSQDSPCLLRKTWEEGAQGLVAWAVCRAFSSHIRM